MYEKFMRGEVMTQDKHKKDFCDMSQPFGTPFTDWQLVNAMLPTKYSPEMRRIAQIYSDRSKSVAHQLFSDTKMLMDVCLDQVESPPSVLHC